MSQNLRRSVSAQAKRIASLEAENTELREKLGWERFCYGLGSIGWAKELEQANGQLVFLANELEAAARQSRLDVESIHAIQAERDAAQAEVARLLGQVRRLREAVLKLTEERDGVPGSCDDPECEDYACRTLRATVPRRPERKERD